MFDSVLNDRIPVGETPDAQAPYSPPPTKPGETPDAKAPYSPGSPEALPPSSPSPRKGRPPGSRDKAPRKLAPGKKPRAARPAQTAASTETPKNPFQDPVAGEQPAAREGRVGAPTELIDMISKLPTDKLGAVVIDVANGAIVEVASMRYGTEDADHLKLHDDEKAILSPLMGEWLKSQAIQATPGEALAVACLVMFGQRIAVLERRRSDRKRGGIVVASEIRP